MVQCCVPSCKNRSDHQNWKKQLDILKVTFHSFPKNNTTRKLWIDILHLETSISSTARVCSAHFKEEFLERTNPSLIRLKPNALPFRKEEQEKESFIACSQSPVKADKAIMVSIKPCTEDKATRVSLKRINDSPEKSRLRQQIKILKTEHRKQIRGLQQNLRRRLNQIAALKDVLDILQQKQLLTENQSDVLHNLRGYQEELFKRLLKKQKNESVPKQYEPQLRVFALTLHYYSPHAYSYVRNELNLCLPHPKTISAWYRTINGNTGISTEALDAIKIRVQNTDYILYGSMQFDEMAIREHLEYDGEKFSGYTDLGYDIACDDNTLATEALVFMITCINSAWKIPLAYYFVKGISSKEKSNLLIECLKAVHETGLKIVSVTCDGTSTNLSVFKNLGCDFQNVSSLQTSFSHPMTSDKVVAFLDLCHMLKLVRNTFGDTQTLIDMNNNMIQWSHIIKLHEVQEKEGMHMGNKLRSMHVNYVKQKMKVRLAAQVFSKSVSDSLSHCKNKLKLNDFLFCEGTIQFLSIFNDLFDILNSKNMRQCELKQALNSKNIELVKKKFTECKSYILLLKNKNGELVINSRRKTGFLGFLICVESVLTLYEELCEKNALKYIPFYKFSQDHVELLFGCLRHHGGGNNNPTVRQFKAAMKKILVHANIRSSNTGNCIPLEEISILHVTSANEIKQSQDIINLTCRSSRFCDEFDEKDYSNEDNAILSLINDHNYVSDIREISEFSSHIIQYIAGYIIRKLMKTLLCENCLSVLVTQTQKNNLIDTKNRGKLIQPSDEVIRIARKCEVEIRCAVYESKRFIKKKFNGDYLVNRILQQFINTDLFTDLNEHTHEQFGMENHAVHLTRTIVQKYVKIRLHYIALHSIDKQKANSQRHLFNKLTLFKGQ